MKTDFTIILAKKKKKKVKEVTTKLTGENLLLLQALIVGTE